MANALLPLVALQNAQGADQRRANVEATRLNNVLRREQIEDARFQRNALRGATAVRQEAGGQAARGDFAGAANTSFEAGLLKEGADFYAQSQKLDEQQRAQQKQLVQNIGLIALEAQQRGLTDDQYRQILGQRNMPVSQTNTIMGDVLRARGFGEADKAAREERNRKPITRKLSLPNGMVQDQQSADGGRTWNPVGEPYDRRDPLKSITFVDEQGNMNMGLVDTRTIGQEDNQQEPRIVGLSRKPRAVGEAATISSARSAITDLSRATGALFDNGKLNRRMLLGSSLPWTDGRSARQEVRRAIEVVLRARTGAAAPDQEVDNYMALYFPSVFDQDDAAVRKVQALNEFLGGILNEVGAVQQQRAAPQIPAGARVLRYNPETDDFEEQR